MKKIALGISLAAMVAAGTAYAQPGMRWNPDRNGDGVITRAEAKARAEQMFAMLDANHDGKLNQADREARRNQMFDRIDTNHDGVISRAEFDAMHRGWRSGPGGRGKGWHGYGRHHGFGAMARMADTNHDGSVSKAEFVAAALKRFDQADTNHDGKVTKAERQAAWATMRQKWHNRMGGMGGGPNGPGGPGPNAPAPNGPGQ